MSNSGRKASNGASSFGVALRQMLKPGRRALRAAAALPTGYRELLLPLSSPLSAAPKDSFRLAGAAIFGLKSPRIKLRSTAYTVQRNPPNNVDAYDRLIEIGSGHASIQQPAEAARSLNRRRQAPDRGESMNPVDVRTAVGTWWQAAPGFSRARAVRRPCAYITVRRKALEPDVDKFCPSP